MSERPRPAEPEPGDDDDPAADEPRDSDTPSRDPGSQPRDPDTRDDGSGPSVPDEGSGARSATPDERTESGPGSGSGSGSRDSDDGPDPHPSVPADVRSYDRFKKIEGGEYDRVNDFLRDRTYVTAREWAIARLCADFRTETGVEMTKIGENLPELVPFMTDTYSPQAVNQARASFEGKVRKAGATFLYGAMSGFFTAEELDDVMYEVSEVAKFLLEVEGVDLSVEEELEAEERISTVMREVREASSEIRHDECPHCGRELGSEE